MRASAIGRWCVTLAPFTYLLIRWLTVSKSIQYKNIVSLLQETRHANQSNSSIHLRQLWFCDTLLDIGHLLKGECVLISRENHKHDEIQAMNSWEKFISYVWGTTELLAPVSYNLINVVNNLLQCCAAPCQQCAALSQQLLSTIIVHSCSRSTTIVQSLLTTINKLVLSTVVGSCSNNIVTTIVFCQHRTTIDRTVFINIVNSTSFVEPW